MRRLDGRMMHCKRLGSQYRQPTGATGIEILVTLVVLGILAAIAAPNIVPLGNQTLPDAANRAAGQFRAARAKAIAQTAQFRVRPAGTFDPTGLNTGLSRTQLVVERAVNTSTACAATTGWTTDHRFTPEDLTFGSGIELSRAQVNPTGSSTGDVTPTNWWFCFTNRGIGDKNLILTLQRTSDLKTQRFEVFPGGTVQVYDN